MREKASCKFKNRIIKINKVHTRIIKLEKMKGKERGLKQKNKKCVNKNHN